MCQVCGKPDVFGLVEQEHWMLCWDCQVMGYGYPEERKKKTCRVCGKFPLAWGDHYCQVRSQPDEDGFEVDFLCREHFEQRQAT